MIYADFIKGMKSTVFPDREPINLVASHNNYFLDGLIEVQRRVPQLREHNFNLYAFEATFYRCRTTVIEKPDGPIIRLYTYTTEDQCDSIFYAPTTREHMEALMKKAQSCFMVPTPVGGETIGGEFIPFEPLPLGLLRSEKTTDKMWRAGSGYFAVMDDQIYIYPHIESNERIGVEWQGVKTSYLPTDIVTFSRDVQSVVELWVQAQASLREDCDAGKYTAFITGWTAQMAELTWWYRTKSLLPEPPWRGDACDLCNLARIGAGTTPPESFTTFAAFGDSGVTPGPNGPQIKKLVDSLGVDYIIHTGDTTYPSAIEPDLTNNFIKPWTAYIPERLWLAFGNHDLDGDGGLSLVQFFPNILFANEPNLYYVLIKPNVDFFFLNSGASGVEELNPTSVQITWLLSELATSKTERPDSWRIVVCHKPQMTSAAVHTMDSDLPKLPDLKAAGADLMLTGHGHLYERIELPGGLPQLTVGTGGAPLYNAVEPPVCGSKRVIDDKFGCLKFTVSATRLLWSFYATDGTLFDTQEMIRSTVAA